MDLTPPGAPAEGHIYLNDPTGEIITYYKDTKAATSKKPNGKIVAFATAEGLISYLTTLPSNQKSANSLSQAEMDIIVDMAKTYGLKSNIDYIGPKATGTPFMAILDKAGQVRFTVRKLANKFFCYKIVYNPNVVKGTPESVVHQGDWNTLIKELHVQFATLAQPTMTTADADPNKLSMSELKAINKLAKSYTLTTTQPIVTTVEPPSIVIQSNMGSNIWAVRKSNSEYQIINAISAQNWEIIGGFPTFSEMLLSLMKLFEKYITEPQAPEKMGPYEFSPQESSDISKLASQFGLLIKGTTMTLEPDKHQVAGIEFLKPDGKIVFHVHKDNGTYSIFKVFDNGAGSKTWDHWYQGQNANAFFQQLTIYLNGHTPGEPAGSIEHNGITYEEYQQIKETVESYGEKFWSEYVHASHGQTSHVEVFYKPDPNEPGTIIFSVGAMGNYYQINGPDNKPKENSPTLNGIIAKMHDRLAAIAGEQATISPDVLDEITNLVTSIGFSFTGDAPEGDEPYEFSKGTESVLVKQYGAVSYENEGVFGPVYWEKSKAFINWFKNTYLQNKVPKTTEQFADGILKVLKSGGFLDKTKFTVIPHQKIYAIKALRVYVMHVTGGPCGLGKTKWAVENLNQFLDYLKQHGLPNMDSNAQEFMDKSTSEPHQVSVPHKLLQEEQEEIVKIVGKYSPAIKYQFSPDDAVVIWIGNHITSYKVAKEHDVYRVYTDKDSEWVIQNQTSTFNELTAYLDDMLAHIAKALANSKLKQPPQQTAPSLNPDKLSASEVDELKKLIKQFKLPVSTSYSKKLMEAAGVPQEAYSMTVMDDPHKVYIKIYKQQGKYIFAKGLSDAYFPLKSFSNFEQLLAYADYFFNSYIKGELPAVDKISDDEVKMLRDLVKKFKVKGKVRRKYMTSSGQKVPYVFIELDDIGMKDYAVSKTAKGVYKLFEVDTLFEDWKNLAVTDTWEGIYDIVSKVLNDEPIPDDNEKYNPPVLNADQFEWLETLMKTQKPGVFVKKWGNGVIGGYDPSVKINGENNPLFVIRFAHDNPHNARILQVQTKDGGMDSDEYPFNTFEALAHFIVTNIEVVTQLLKGDVAPESKLADLMDKNGFKFHHEKTNVEIDGVNKSANMYENDTNERLYLFSDGGSRIWYMDKTVGDIVSKDFKTIPELVDWMETNYGEKPPADLTEIKQYLAYLDYKIEGHKSDKFSTVWVKEFGAEHQPGYDYVHLHADGASKVNPSPLLGDGAPPSSAFFFNTTAGLKQYLSEKHVKGKNWINALFNQVLSEGKFQKIADQNTEMGFKFQTDQMTVVPFPSGGIMETTSDFTPQLKFSFESTYDLAKRIDLFNEGHNTAVADNGPSTGYTELDTLIKTAGFKFQGQEDTPDHGPKLVFLDGGGIKLTYYSDDEGSSIQFPAPTPIEQKGIGFTTVEDLIDHLKKYNEPPATADAFAKNVGYAGLLKTIAAYEFKQTDFKNAPDEQPYKIFKRPDGAMVNIWGTGVCAYKAPSDKANWQYSKSFSELDDKLKKLYDKVTSTSEYPSILKYDKDTIDIIVKDLANIADVTDGAIDSVHFQYNNQPTGQGEIRFVGGNVLKFAIGKKIVGTNVLWYVRQKVSDNPSGLYRVYTFVEHHKDAMVKWIQDNTEKLSTHKSIKDAEGHNLGQAEGPPVGVVPKNTIETGEQFVPSGETYKTHDVAGNADMIWLNEHDTALLQSLGFVPVPAENKYYKNSTGNIVKFFDTGKAEYVDYFGHPNQPENGEVVEFEDIPHTLKFMVAKHTSFPFSVHQYKSDDGTNVLEIPLNQHDNDMLKQLGFEWDVKGQKYVKLIGPNDTPKIQEAKKKKKEKEDPNQMGLPFGGPLHPDKPTPPPDDPGEIPPNDDWEDYSEVFTAYDTGNAIWQSVKGDGPEEVIMNQQEGTIVNILHFIWKRWQHQLALGLLGKITAKGQPPTSPDTIAFLNIEGVEAPPNIHEKFLKRGFIYDTSLKGYYKKYELDPKLLWTLVKYDGNNYHVSRPYKSWSGKIEHKEFTNVDPYLVLNTILKIENAEFMDLVQSEEDALKKKDASYFNAPNGWLPYNPYSPKKNPNNITPESWIDKELGGYGFVWKPNSGMYYLVDTEGKIGTNWHAVRFDQNGTIVYFYHNKKGDPRYFCSKDFAEVQHKIEVNHPGAELFQPGGTSAGTVPPKTYPLDAKNYPMAPDWNKNFSTQGNAITLTPSDHKAVLEVGFKFSVADGTYSNLKTKDQFKIFSNGFAWYKLTGTGEGMDNNLEHFFDMLKSKYGPLEWGFHPLTGHEVVQIKDKFDKLGFEAVEHPEAADDLYFERYPTDGVSSTNVKEVVVVFPNHTMNFYLYDATSKDKLLGVSEFESLSYGIHALEDFKHLIKLHLAHDLEPELTSHGFAYVPDKLRYEHVLGNGGLKIYINFFGNGQAKAQLMEPDSSTSDGHEEVKEKTFMSFYDAILWAAHKNFEEIKPPGGKPVSKKEVAKVMKDLGFKNQGHLSPDTVTYNTSLGKVINVELSTGIVTYNFQYIADDVTGELKWGQSVFYNWEVFTDFLAGTTQVKPKKGKLSYTPHPVTKELPKMLPPGQGPPIKGKIQPPEKSVPGMPFSDFDYEGWAKGTEHNPKSTIKLVNNDDLLMHQIGFHSKQTDNDAYYYHNNNGDLVYFFVDGHAQIIPKDSAPITLPKVKMAISMLWAQHHEDKKTPDADINDPANWGVKPAASGGLDVTNELIDLGFHPLASSGGELIFEKKDKKITHLVRWNKDEHTIDYTAHKSGDSSVVTASFKEDVNVGLAMLGHIFTPKLTEQEFVVEKMEELGFKVVGGKPPKGAQSNTITFIRFTPKSQFDVIYHVDQKMMEFIKSNAKMKKGYHKIVEQWTLNVSDALGKLENLFAFGSLGTVPSKKTKMKKAWKKAKILAGTEDMPWSDTDYLNWGNVVLKAMGTVKDGMSLHPTEVATLKQMGWNEVGDSKVGYSYEHGIEKIVFHPSGYVEYWSNKNGQPTQHWQEIEMPIRWLWKNKGSVQKKPATGDMPWSNMNYEHSKAAIQMGKDPVYTTITLYSIEEETMKKMGFHRLENNGVKWYEKTGAGNHVMFFADGHASMTDKTTGTEMEYFKTVKEAMQFLWDKYMPFIEESFFKDLANVLLTHPDAAKMLM